MATLNKYLNNKFLKSLEPLSRLTVDKLSELAKKSNIESIPAGRTVFRQGEKDKLSYYLVSGQIELQVTGQKKSETIKSKTPETKYPIAQQLPRPCSVKTKVACEFLTIDTSLLEMLIESDDNPSGTYEVTELNSDDENGWMLKFLQSRAFLQIPTENIQKILMSMKEINIPKGTAIVSQGETNDFYYIVKQGKCSVSRRPSPKAEEVQIAILAAGDGFGEEALIIEGHRNATVRMLENGILMRLTKEDFLSLLVEPLLDYIHLDELKSRVAAGDLLVDVRQHKDFMAAHLDGAVNTPLSMVRLKLNTFNMDRNTIVYCNDASRSTAAAFLLIQNGITCSILKDGLSSQGVISNPADTSSTSMSKIISNLDAVTNREKDSIEKIRTEKIPAEKIPTVTAINSKKSDAIKSTYKADKIKEQIDILNKKNQKAEAAQKQAADEKQQFETEKHQLVLETQKLKDQAEVDKLAAQQELQKLSDEYTQHKEEIEAKQLAELEAKNLHEQAEIEKIAFQQEQEQQKQAQDLIRNQEIVEQKDQAQREALALQKKFESQKLAAEVELEKQKEHVTEQLERQKNQAQREALTLQKKIESQKLAAEIELAKQKEHVTEQLERQKKIAQESQKQVKLEAQRVRLQADKELADLRAELEKTKNTVQERAKELKEKQMQQANEEIRNRQQHANDAIKESIEKAREQAASDAEKVRQQALQEAKNSQVDIERKKQQFEIDAENIRLEAERDRAVTLELARKQAKEIVLKTAEEAQQLDAQRQRIEDHVSKITNEAELKKEQTIKLAEKQAIQIRIEAEQKAKQRALKEIEQQQSTMELSIKQAEEIRLQAEKEADIIRATALQSATDSSEKIKAMNTNEPVSDDMSFAGIQIPGAGSVSLQNTSMAESDAKNLAQEIVSKLEAAESNRIKDQHHTGTNNGLTLSSASLKRRSDGKIILEGDEDLFVFKEPRNYSDTELDELKATMDGEKRLIPSTSPASKVITKDAELPEFSFDEPDFDLVDELPNHINNPLNNETSISEFSDFEVHQPSDIRQTHKPSSKRPAQRFVAIAASVFVAVGVGITFMGINSETNESQVASVQDNSFNATRVSGIAANNIEIDKKVMNQAEHEFEKLLSKWKKSQTERKPQSNAEENKPTDLNAQ